MSKKRAIQKQVAAQSRALPQTQAQAQPPQAVLAQVAVLTITFIPESNQVAAVLPVFPMKMNSDEVLHILRAAEEFIIRASAKAEGKAQRGGSAPA